MVCIFIKVGRHINDEERMIRIDFRGQSSKDKVLPHQSGGDVTPKSNRPPFSTNDRFVMNLLFTC